MNRINKLHVTKVNFKKILKFGFDLILVAVSWLLAYLIRFNLTISLDQLNLIINSLVPLLLFYGSFFILSSLYISPWRFSSILDLKRIITLVLAAGIIFSTIILFYPLFFVPRSILLIHPLLVILFIGGSRFSYRLFYEYRTYGQKLAQAKPCIVFADKSSMISLIKTISNNSKWRIAGIFTDDESLFNREVLGIKVFGGKSELKIFLSQHRVIDVIFSMPKLKVQDRLELVNYLTNLDKNYCELSTGETRINLMEYYLCLVHQLLDIFDKNAPVSSDSVKELMDQVKEDFAFLFVGHWLPGQYGEDRKNVALTIKLFLESC